MRRSFLAAPLLACLLLFGCWPDSKWTDFRGGSTDCVIAVFRPGTTPQESSAFTRDHLQGPPHPTGGNYLPPGVSSLFLRGVGSGSGYEICFENDADPASKRQIKEAIRDSPVIACLLEDKDAEEGLGCPHTDPVEAGREASGAAVKP